MFYKNFIKIFQMPLVECLNPKLVLKNNFFFFSVIPRWRFGHQFRALHLQAALRHRNQAETRRGKEEILIMSDKGLLKGWRYAAFVGGLFGSILAASYPIIIEPWMNPQPWKVLVFLIIHGPSLII